MKVVNSMRKRHWFMIGYFLVGVLLLVLTEILKLPIIIGLGGIVLALSLVLIKNKEMKYINSEMVYLVKEEGYSQAIDYLDKAKDACLVPVNYHSCIVTMVICCIINDEFDKAKPYLEMNKYQNNKWLYYTRFVYAIYLNDIKEAHRLHQLIQKSKVSNQNQKNATYRILRMIETGKYDEKLYGETTYPFLKRLCLKYKKED